MSGAEHVRLSFAITSRTWRADAAQLFCDDKRRLVESIARKKDSVQSASRAKFSTNPFVTLPVVGKVGIKHACKE